MESRRMRRAGHVARVGRGERRVQVFGGETKERAHLVDQGVDGRIILKWIIKKWDGALAGLIWLRTGAGGGLL
jgi:hypothetical protein